MVGLDHQRPRHLEQLALTARQRAGELVAHVVELEPLEQLVGPRLDRRPPAARHSGRTRAAKKRSPRWSVRAELHVVEHRQAGQRLGELEGAHHARSGDLVGGHAGEVVAVEGPVAAVRLVEPGEQVEERGLAGAVGADEGGDRAALHLEVVDVDGRQAAEARLTAVDDEDRVGLGRPGFALTQESATTVDGRRPVRRAEASR